MLPTNIPELQQVQSGTAINNANRIQTIAIATVDTTSRSSSSELEATATGPGGSLFRGRLTATTIEFERVTDNVPTGVVINIQ